MWLLGQVSLYHILILTKPAATDGPTDGRTNQPESVSDVAHHPGGDNRQRAVRIKEQRVSPKAQNYMETGGYRVGIVGGRHYEIDGEEFVEMDHGSSYRIRLTNSHLSSCEAQLDIDGKVWNFSLSYLLNKETLSSDSEPLFHFNQCLFIR